MLKPKVKIENLNDSPEHFVSLLKLYRGRSQVGCVVAKVVRNGTGSFTAICTERTMAGEKIVTTRTGDTPDLAVTSAAHELLVLMELNKVG